MVNMIIIIVDSSTVNYDGNYGGEYDGKYDSNYDSQVYEDLIPYLAGQKYTIRFYDWIC